MSRPVAINSIVLNNFSLTAQSGALFFDADEVDVGLSGALTGSIDWVNRVLLDNLGNTGLDWQQNKLFSNITNNVSVDWNDWLLYDGGGSQSVDWANGFMYDSDGTSLSVNWRSHVLASANLVTIDWAAMQLSDNGTRTNAQSPSVNWSDRTLFNTGSIITVDWEAQKLFASNNVVSIDWAQSILSGNWSTNSSATGDNNLVNYAGLRTATSSIPAPTNNSSHVFPGIFPNVKYPHAAIYSSPSGGVAVNVYTVPSGRKALVSDYLITNSTPNTITYYPVIKISGAYYQLGGGVSESPFGTGHNYGTASTSRSQAILLNAGETIGINADNTGITAWFNVTEFDSTSPLNRADITHWVSGINRLFTCPANQTAAFGTVGIQNGNIPVPCLNAISYINNCGSTRIITSVNIVRANDTPTGWNALAGTNTIFNGAGFSKYHPGGFGSGDYVAIVLDSSATGQYAWLNYVLY